MLTFDIEKLRSHYVYIVAVTSNYVYVHSHRNGQPYTQNTQEAVYRGRAVRRLRIHPSVAHKFRSRSHTTYFTDPRLTSINFYDQDVVGLELQPYSHRDIGGFTNSDEWQSGFSIAKGLLKDHLESSDIDRIYFDGSDIYWSFARQSPLFAETILDKRQGKHFRLRSIQYLELSKLGAQSTERLSNQKNSLVSQGESQHSGEKLSRSYSLSFSDGMALVYQPEPESHPDLEVYSPVFRNSLTGIGNTSESRSELRGIYNLCNKSNPAYVNLEFVLQAARIIGELYGYEKNDFFPIPDILADIGVINITEIKTSSRLTYPVPVSATSAVAWLLGFFHRETDISSLRQLSIVIRKSLTTGLILLNSVSDEYLYHEGYGQHSIKMKSLKDIINASSTKKENKSLKPPEISEEEYLLALSESNEIISQMVI